MIARRTIAVATRIEPVVHIAPAPAPRSAHAELASLDQWVVSGHDKTPQRLNERADRLIGASHSEPAHWTSYAAATAAAARFGAAGVGFVFSDADPYTFIDFDGCRDPETGAIEPWAGRWITALKSATEISRSGTGCHTFVRGKLPRTLIQKLGEHKGIEVYGRKRYCAVTGIPLPGTPETINEAQPILDAMLAEFAPPKPKPEPKPVRKITPGEQAAERATLAEVKATFEAAHDLDSLLAEYGAVEVRPGYYSCPFCTHSHDITLSISREGRLFSLSPQCKLYTTKGWDAFGLYVMVEHNNDVTAALKALNPLAPRRKRREEPPPPEAPPRRYSAEERAAYNAERKARRHEETRQDLATLADRVHALDLSDRAFALFDHLHHIASERGVLQVAPTNAQLAAALDMCERYIQYAFRELEAAGIGRRQGGRNVIENIAATWTFYRSPNLGCKARPNAECTLEYREYDLIPNQELVSAAPPAPGDTLDTWCWSDDGHGADDLAFLDEPPALPPIEPPAAAEPPVIVSVSTPDARGMCLVRWSDGSATWRRQEPARSGESIESYLPKLHSSANFPNEDSGESLAEPGDDTHLLDMAEIDRMVAEIQAVADARRDERHEPRTYWESHEARIWRETHPVAPEPPAVAAQRLANDERDKARLRAKWDGMAPSQLDRELCILRNRVKSRPKDLSWAGWRICELNDRLAALTPAAPVERPGAAARGLTSSRAVGPPGVMHQASIGGFV